MLDLFRPLFTLFGFEAARADHNEVNKPTNTEKTACKEPDYASSNLAGKETVDTEFAKEKCDEYSNDFVHSKPPKLEFENEVLSDLYSIKKCEVCQCF